MPTKLTSVRPNLLNGLLTDQVDIESGLTIVAGANGTGKSKFLESIKAGTSSLDLKAPPEEGGTVLTTTAFSPKRNSVKRAFRDLVNESISQNRRLANRLQELVGAGFQDTTYAEYPSFPEMFFHAFRGNDSAATTNHQEALDKTELEFNRIVKSVFTGIELRAEWNEADGVPELLIKKAEISEPIQINEVSTGEQEILSLIFNINAAAESSNMILIDEPEVHLNWGLETKLFAYFKRFAEQKNIQIIVTTHSRVINLPEYRDLVRYFYWDGGKIHVGSALPSEQIEAVAGEAIQFVQALPDPHTTIFVEDKMQRDFIVALLRLFKKDESKVKIIIAGDKGSVLNLFKALKNRDDVNEASLGAYFLVDGDGDAKIKSAKFCIQLEKYSIESYFFSNLEALKLASGLRKPTLESKLYKGLGSHNLGGVKKYSEVFRLFMGHANLDKRIINSNIYDVIDCKPLVKAVGVGSATAIEKYVDYLGIAGAKKVFDKKLIGFITSQS